MSEPTTQRILPYLRTGGWLVVASLSSLLAINGSDAQVASAPSAPRSTPSTDQIETTNQGETGTSSIPGPNLQDQAVVLEINEIRKQLGGGVVETLSGMLDPPMKRELQESFDQQIRSLKVDVPPIGTPFGLPTLQMPLPRPSHGFSSQHASAVPAKFRSGDPHAALTPSRAVDLGSREIQVIRRSARRIDEVAADLEELGIYAEADRLREAARRLRQHARRMSGNKSS